MAFPPGDQFTIRIGGDAFGPIVAGYDNRVEVNHPQPGAQAGAAPAGERQAPGPAQTNTANDHGTVFTVMNGDLHLHRDDPRPPAAEPPANRDDHP